MLRMQMMPYWYTEFAKYHFEGIPPFRAMNLEEGFDHEIKKEAGNTNLEENPYAEATTKEIKDQYMAGEYLLVAPLFAGQTNTESDFAKRQMVRLLYRGICRRWRSDYRYARTG